MLIFRQTGECLNALLMRDAFDDICVWSRCYLDFNINYNNSHSYIQKKMKENETFGDFVRVSFLLERNNLLGFCRGRVKINFFLLRNGSET